MGFGGWWGNGDIVRNCSAVTAACLMVRPSVFWQVGGFDDHRLRSVLSEVVTVRIVGSSQANLYASISAGICALWGPLHGGANQEVLEMLEKIRDDGGDYMKFVALDINKALES